MRVDTGVLSGSTVPGTFDSLMAKLIVTGATRAHAIARARRALEEFRIEGVASVLPFHRTVMQQPDFTSADVFKVHTRWIETDFANTLAAAARSEPPVSDAALVRAAVEIDGRRMALGLPAELLRGLQSAARRRRIACGGSTRRGGPRSGRRAHRRYPADVEGRRWRHRGPGRHHRHDGGDEDGDDDEPTEQRQETEV